MSESDPKKDRLLKTAMSDNLERERSKLSFETFPLLFLCFWGLVIMLTKACATSLITMFVQDIKTFSVLHDCWLTILSHPFNFSTTQCNFLSSIWISTYFYCRCVMFAVGDDLMLRVQKKYHNIKTVVMLGHNGFGWKMMTVCVCHTNVMLWELFASKILYLAFPPNSNSSLSPKFVFELLHIIYSGLKNSWQLVFWDMLHHFYGLRKFEYSGELIKLLTASSIFPHQIYVLWVPVFALMVQCITRNATIKSSNKNEDIGHSSSDEISFLSSSSSGSKNNGLSNHVEQVFDQILLGKTKLEVNKKAGTTRGTNGNTSGYILLYLQLCWAGVASENKSTATGDKPDGESMKKYTFNIAIFSAKEASKDLKKWTRENTYMILNLPFDVWRAQLLIWIKKTLNPRKLNINDYKIISQWLVFHHHLSQLPQMKNTWICWSEWGGVKIQNVMYIYVQELCSLTKVDSLLSSVYMLAEFQSTETW